MVLFWKLPGEGACDVWLELERCPLERTRDVWKGYKYNQQTADDAVWRWFTCSSVLVFTDHAVALVSLAFFADRLS